MPFSAPLVEIARGCTVESVHHGVLVVARPDGTPIEERGDPARGVVLRSAAKPFQAAYFVASGAADAFGVTDAELAVAAGSHGGTAADVAAALSLLQRAGLDESALQCGVHPPFDAGARLASRGSAPRALQNNCSGKHAAMLAGAVHAGFTTADYLDPAHPWQQGIRALLAEAAGLAPDAIGVVVDGCNAPSFVLPAAAAARAFAVFAAADPGTPLGRVRRAMLEWPAHVAGDGRLETELMRACPGRLVAKSGAEGVLALAVAAAEGPLGIVIKIDDGDAAARARAAVAITLVERRAALPAAAADALRRTFTPAPTTLTGRVVGDIRPLL